MGFKCTVINKTVFVYNNIFYFGVSSMTFFRSPDSSLSTNF